MTNTTQASQLKAIISNHYDLGELVDYEQLYLGYVNLSYIVTTKPDRKVPEKRVCVGRTSHAHPFFGIIRSLAELLKSDVKKKKYFLRRYKRGIKEEEITFEHSIINHLTKKNFRLVARVISTRDGKTYIKRSESGGNVFCAIFDFLTGDDRYTWVNPTCSDDELRAAAAVLAQFHDTICDLDPEGKRYEAKIIDLLPGIAQTVEGCAQKAGKTVFDAYFMKNIQLIQEAIQRIQRVMEMEKDEYSKIIQLVIHCDYHPGNLKFQNGEITGLFDFDWSKVDVRCFDVALAMTYFCVAWEGKQDGDLQLNKAAVFLDAYQNMLRDAPDVGPLCDVELKFLPYLIGASNIYILNWTIGDFYSTEVNPHEYLTYLQHGIRFMRWLENKDNWGRLKRTVCA